MKTRRREGLEKDATSVELKNEKSHAITLVLLLGQAICEQNKQLHKTDLYKFGNFAFAV